MRYSLLLVFVFFYTISYSQLNTDSVYPVFKKISYRFTKKVPVQKIAFSYCADGNCNSGRGVLLVSEILPGKYSYSTLVLFTLHVGDFAEAGKKFNGKIYQGKTSLDYQKPEKDTHILTPPQKLDFKDTKTLDSLFAGEGQASRFDLTRSFKWNGEVRLPGFEKNFPEIQSAKTICKDGQMYWADIAYKEGSYFKHFTGRVFSSGHPFSGKATLADGSMLEGIFFGYDLVGPGIKTTKAGKKTTGIFQMDSLLIEMPVEIPLVLTAPEKPVVKYTFYGNLKNDLPEGWGVVESARKLELFNYKDGKRIDPGIVIKLPVVNNTGWEEHLFWYKAGYFDGEKLKTGVHIIGENQLKLNEDILPTQIPKMQFTKARLYSGTFNTYETLEGCGIVNYLKLAKYNANKILPGASTLANHERGSLTGWYFGSEGIKLDNFSFENIGHKGSSDYELDFEQLKKWEADTIYCHPAMALYKADYINKYRKIATDRIASRGIDARNKDSLNRVYNNMSAKEKCAYHTAGQKYKAGNVLKSKGYSSLGSDAFVISFDCNTGNYTVMARTYNAARKTFFKTNDEVAYYALSKQTLTDKYIDNSYQLINEQAEICSICGGHGATYRDVVHTRGGSWENTYNPYVRIYTPERIIASWKERLPCTFCGAAGWRAK